MAAIFTKLVQKKKTTDNDELQDLKERNIL